MKGSSRFKHGLDQAVLWLISRDDVGVAFFKLLAVDDEIFFEGKKIDVVLKDQFCQMVASCIFFLGSKNVGLVGVCVRFFFDLQIKIFHPLVEFYPHFFGSLVGG